MSLDDISDLLAVWPHGECRSLQARLRAFLVARIDEVTNSERLGTFERQLNSVLGRLWPGTPDLNAAEDAAASPTSMSPPLLRCPIPGRGCSLDVDDLAVLGCPSGVPWPLLRCRRSTRVEGCGSSSKPIPS